MRVAFLGTSSAEPTAHNGFTSFLLEAEGLLVLVDASGNPVQSILRAGRDPRELDVVVLTHHHADHIAGYPSLVQTLGCMGRSRGLEVLCTGVTLHKARALHELLELESPNSGYPVRFQEGYDCPGVQIRLLPGNHSIPTSMVWVAAGAQSLFYTSDTAYTPRAAEAARGCATLIHEATVPHAQAGAPGQEGHSSAYQAGLAAAAAGAKRLLLCHICWHRYRGGRDAAGAAARQASAASRASLSRAARLARAEAASAFGGRVTVPQPFRWYEL